MATMTDTEIADPFARTPEEAEISRLRFKLSEAESKLAATERWVRILREALEEDRGSSATYDIWLDRTLQRADRVCLFCGTGEETTTQRGELLKDDDVDFTEHPTWYAHAQCRIHEERRQEWESHRDYD